MVGDYMELKVIGSGSDGNCYVLENEMECLVIEAGVNDSKIKEGIGFQINKVVGCIISHCHGDHAGYADKIEKMCINTFKPYKNYSRKEVLGGFTIYPFHLPHDVDNYGFVIQHKDVGTMLYLTDFEYCKNTFKKLNPSTILIAANYDETKIDKESVNFSHVVNGHSSIQTTCRFLEANNNPMLQNVILCHLSNDNANGDDFIAKAKEIVYCDVTVARKGMEINISLPF
jgi:ribonuclease BN (tRNA processing enzyme)